MSLYKDNLNEFKNVNLYYSSIKWIEFKYRGSLMHLPAIPHTQCVGTGKGIWQHIGKIEEE